MVRGDKQDGAVLMEVMLSMALLGAALCALVTAMSVSLNAQARVESQELAEGLAATKVLELRLQPGPGEAQGRFPEPLDAYRWHSRVESPHTDGAFLRATVEIQKGEHGRVHRVHALLAKTAG